MESWLATTPATVILVTHDRYFLDAVVEQMLELREGQLRVYAGAYTEYLEARALEEAHGTTVRKRRLQLLRGELEWARRSPKARRSKAKARLSRLQDVQREHRELQVEERIAEVRFGDPPRLGKTILELTSVTRGYGEEPPLIRDFSMILRRGERFGIVGPNGCGKSTLLRMIAGQLEPERGTITRGSNTRIAWFDQTRSFLDPSATVRQTVLPAGGEYVTAGGERRHVVGWLGRFAFPTSTHQLKVSSLSGGERNRLAIAKLLLEEANLFLLDEPTNDIDLLTLNVLEEALVSFPGCLLVVSHDRYFLDKIATSIIAFEGAGDVSWVQGDYTHYQRLHGERVAEEKAAASRRRAQEKQEAQQTQTPRPSNEQRLTWKEERELETIEGDIDAVEAAIRELQAVIADPNVWTEQPEHARLSSEALSVKEAEATTLVTRWEELMEKSS
jgi:ATP-binding cassette subfamily F protein uup